MPISSKFDFTKHIRAITKQLHNERVTNFFKKMKDKDGKKITVADDDVSTSLSSLKQACMIATQDSLVMVQSKVMLFNFIKDELSPATNLLESMYGLPVATYRATVRFVPQISLEFLESYEDAKKSGHSQLKTSVTFRLANHTAESLSQSDLREYARKISNIFTLDGEGKEYRKGGVQYCYRDEELGYRLRILVSNESEGEKMVRDILDIQNHSFKEKNVSVSESKKESGSRPPAKSVLGDVRELPRYRPVADVIFNRAWVDIWEMPKPIMLCRVRNGSVETFEGI